MDSSDLAYFLSEIRSKSCAESGLRKCLQLRRKKKDETIISGNRVMAKCLKKCIISKHCRGPPHLRLWSFKVRSVSMVVHFYLATDPGWPKC